MWISDSSWSLTGLIHTLGKCVNNYTSGTQIKRKKKLFKSLDTTGRDNQMPFPGTFLISTFDFKTLHCRLNNQKEPGKKATYLIKDKLEKHDNIEENPKKKPKRLLN